MTRRIAPLMAVMACTITGAAAQHAWQHAVPGRAIVLPRDHASHPGYKIEWWYYTGNLDASDGRRFGYQLTFFRIGVDPAPQNPSRWAVRDLFMAHLALTDVEGKRYQFAERVNRAGPGWAGAATDTYRVWNEDWRAALVSPGAHELHALSGAFGVDLTLREDRPAVLEGHEGYSRKGAQPGNASYYYSFTRMPTRGTVTLDGRAVQVSGESWMDHEFGTSVLEPGQRGWDWFSLQLSDDRDLMIFQLRRDGGSIDPRSSGTLVEPDGRVVPVRISREEPEAGAIYGFALEPGRMWTSVASHATYPIAWRVSIPGGDVDLSVTAATSDQELRTPSSTGVTYWEGAVDVAGRMRGHAVTGRGYLEMTGYAGANMGRLLR